MNKVYAVEKRIIGHSACFRQRNATSHCRFLHGYALEFILRFESKELDHRNWVVDFGGLKGAKEFFKHYFDHTTICEEEDPDLPVYQDLDKRGLIQLRVLPLVSCEAFTDFALNTLKGSDEWIKEKDIRDKLVSVTVYEHGLNSASSALR